MNSKIKNISIFILVFCMVPVLSTAQTEDPIYIQIDFMNVKQGVGAEYVAMEQEIWKPVHKERINQGMISYWGLYEAIYTEPDASYNYITVNVFHDLSKLENFFDYEIIESAHPGRSMNAILNRTLESRDFVHNEVWQLVDSVLPEEPNDNARYLVVNDFQVQPGAGGEYLAVEEEYWKPIHEYRVDNEMMAGWHLYELMMPAGSSIPYNYKTVDFYESLGDLEQPLTMELVQTANPELSEIGLDAFMERTLNSRVGYRSVVLERIDFIAAPDD